MKQVVEQIRRQRRILVHCNGGKGRTGLVAGATLMALGMEQDDAVQIMRDTREGMIQNPAQLLYLRAFKKAVQESPNMFAPAPADNQQPLLLQQEAAQIQPQQPPPLVNSLPAPNDLL